MTIQEVLRCNIQLGVSLNDHSRSKAVKTFALMNFDLLMLSQISNVAEIICISFKLCKSSTSSKYGSCFKHTAVIIECCDEKNN